MSKGFSVASFPRTPRSSENRYGATRQSAVKVWLAERIEPAASNQ
jgi:hypothetical protein